MKYFVVLLGLFVSGVNSADARDFGYEKFADVVNQVYRGQYGVIVPFFEMPDATDTARQAEGNPGSIWNFAVEKGRNGGTIYVHADRYCNPSPTPAPIKGGMARVKNWLYRSEISAGGDFTVSGATPTDVISS
jgi:hypothetical protein